MGKCGCGTVGPSVPQYPGGCSIFGSRGGGVLPSLHSESEIDQAAIAGLKAPRTHTGLHG